MVGEKKGLKSLVFLVYLLFGIYFLNYGLNFFTFPEGLSTVVESWIFALGGLLLIIGAINVLRISRLKQPRLF